MAELRFIRTFHPVGQGAFYSEEFEIDGKETFTMVYDCGSSTISPLDKHGKLKKNSKLQKIIKSDLGTKEIDLLFLSHFDADHVNGVELLKPKTIVIPFVNPSHKWILDFLGIIQGMPKLSSLFLDPRAVFSNNPRVLQVLPAEGNSEDTLSPPDQDSINLADPNAFPGGATDIHTIPSGTSLCPPVGNRFWEFIPWNPYYSTFFTSFETAVLACKKLDINKLKDTANGKYIKEKLSDLKKIYDNLTPDNINNHSLQVYSGPTDPEYLSELWHNTFFGRINHCLHHYWSREIKWCTQSIGCLYSGDIMVEETWLRKYLSFLGYKRLDLVGSVQVPHHGSVDNKGWKFLDHLNRRSEIVFVISVGNKNNYGHPSSKVINRLLIEDNVVILVTEDSSSLLIEMAHITLP